MTAFAPRALEFADESTFGDSTATSMTYRPPVFDVKFTDSWERIEDMAIQIRQNASLPPVLGPREGDLEFTVYVPGGNATPSSALSAFWFTKLLGNAIGTTTTPNFQQLTTSGSDADTVVVATSGAAFLAGQMFAVGVRGTGGGGRFGVVASTLSGTTIQSLVALPGSPASGVQVWDTIQVYPTETPSTSQRFAFQWGATGSLYYLHGAVCTGIKFNIPIGAPATCTFTYKAAVVTGPTTITTPTAMSDCLHVPTMNGLCFFQAHATTTHATVCPTEITLELDLGTELKRTICGSGQYQTITGWERTKCVPKLTLKEYWSNTYNTNYALDGASTAFKHFLFQNSADATGKRWGFYMPRMYMVSPNPVVEELGGSMGVSHSYIGTENISPENGTDLAKSAIRFGFA